MPSRVVIPEANWWMAMFRGTRDEIAGIRAEFLRCLNSFDPRFYPRGPVTATVQNLYASGLRAPLSDRVVYDSLDTAGALQFGMRQSSGDGSTGGLGGYSLLERLGSPLNPKGAFPSRMIIHSSRHPPATPALTLATHRPDWPQTPSDCRRRAAVMRHGRTRRRPETTGCRSKPPAAAAPACGIQSTTAMFR